MGGPPNYAKRTSSDSIRSGLQFEVARPPALVEPRFQRPIEPQKDAVTLAGHGLHPVLFVASRCAGREPDRHSTVLVRLDARDRPVDSRQLLVGRKERTGLVVIRCEGPEVFRWDGSW